MRTKADRHKTMRDAVGYSPYRALSKKETAWLAEKGISLGRYAQTGQDVIVLDNHQDRTTLRAIADKVRPGGLLVLIDSQDAKL